MLFWRTPGGRTPTREEIDLARPFVDRAIEMLNPRLVLTLGSLPATEIGNVQIARDHGKVIDLANGIKLIAMYHPNYILLKPSAKREAWAALQDAQKLLKTV
jgi:DNA polymerase